MRKLIYKSKVLEMTGVSYPCIWSWMRLELFPLGRKVGGRTAWFQDEVEEWLENLPKQELKPLTGHDREEAVERIEQLHREQAAKS